MLRAGQHLGKAACVPRSAGLVDPQCVLILLIKADRSPIAVDLVGIAHFPARCGATEKQMAHDAGLKAAQHLALVIIANRYAVAFRVNGRDIRHHRGDGADQRMGGIDDMGGQIAHCPRSAVIGAPGGRGGRVREEIFRMFAPEPMRPADPALGDEIAGGLTRRGADVIKTRHRDTAGCLGRGRHRLGIRRRRPQRLFTKNRFAKRKRRLGNGAVGGLRGGDDHGLNPLIAHQIPPIAGGSVKAKGGAVAFG